jgi:NADH-quinone oxidoreductase subunit N
VRTVELTALAPVLGVAATSIVLMAAIAIRRVPRLAVTLTLVGLAVSLGLLLPAQAALPAPATPLLHVDVLALVLFALIIATAAVVAVLASDYLERRRCPAEEFCLLLLFATLGACILAASSHFASLFLGLELLSISLYAMIAYLRDDDLGLEAGVKYLILAAVSSAFLLFGVALVYAETGSLELAVLTSVAIPSSGPPLLTIAGIALVMIGVGFKLALAPFHMWTADVYQGAPAPVTAFIATASKGAVVAVLLRLLAATPAPPPALTSFVALLSAASIVVGNLLALRQHNLKRLLAYSSVAHLGYLMIAVVAGGDRGAEAAVFYLAGYLPATLIAFGVLSALSPPDREVDRVSDIAGLGRVRPFMAGLLSVALGSLAGIPLTSGFVGKFLVVGAGVDAGRWGLVLILVLGSVLGVYFYLRPVVAMYMVPSDMAVSAPMAMRTSVAESSVLAALLAVVLLLGIWPGPALAVVRAAIGAL